MRDFTRGKAAAPATMSELIDRRRAEGGSLDPDDLALGLLQWWVSPKLHQSACALYRQAAADIARRLLATG